MTRNEDETTMRCEGSGKPRSGLASRVSFPERVLFRDLGTEAVLLELGAGQYYGLDETARRMVSLLREHGRVEPVFQTLLEEFAVSRDELRGDLLRFVDLLASRNLLRIEED